MNFPLKMMVCIFLILPQLIEAQSTINLFNKKNLDGWYAYQVESGKHKHASDLFNVEHHIIRLYGKNAGYLMSEQSFSNFKLTVTFRWNIDPSVIRKSDKKNSGVMYLVPFEAPDMLWPKGIQFQIKEGATGDFILLQDTTLKINGTRTEPGRSVVSKRFEDASKPIGKWNTMVVTVNNGIVTQELNGKLVNKGVELSITEGRILLQYEGYPIDFKKVVVRRLKP